MGLIKEFRDVQQDVNDLKLKNARSEETSRGVVSNTTAGLYKSNVNGHTTFNCTLYNTVSDMLKAYATNSIKLTQGGGSPYYPIKSGINRIPLQAFLAECDGVYAQPLLDANLKWIPVGAQTTPAYYALARVGSSNAIVCQHPAASGGGGGGGGVPASWNEATIDVVTAVEFNETQGGMLTLDVTTTTLHYINSGAN